MNRNHCSKMNSVSRKSICKNKASLPHGEDNLLKILQGTNQNATSVHSLDLKKSIKQEPSDPEYEFQATALTSYDNIKLEKPIKSDVEIKKEQFDANSFIGSVELPCNIGVDQPTNTLISPVEHPVNQHDSYEANKQQSSRLLRMLEATVDDIAAGKVTVGRIKEEDSTNSWEVKSSEDGELLMIFQFVGDEEMNENLYNFQDLPNQNDYNGKFSEIQINVKREPDIPEMLRIMPE